MTATAPHQSDPRRILVRGVNWLGDAVMTTPAMLRLRERFPSAEIRVLCHQKLAPLWEHHPAVDATISFAPGESSWAIAGRLRSGHFDLGLVLPNSPRSALELFLARVPERVGYARPWRNFFLTRPVAHQNSGRMRKRSVAEIRRLIAQSASSAGSLPSPGRPVHQIHDYLRLVASVGASPEPLPPRLQVAEEEIARTRSKFLAPLGSDAILVGLNPGAEYGPAKRWPAENFVATARAIRDRSHHVHWLLFGAAGDVAACEKIAVAIGGSALNLAGKTSLRELMALMKLCGAVLTNDTGPMHLAAALGTPVVALFGSTSPELTGPGLPGATDHQLLCVRTPCAPCFRRTCPIDGRCLAMLKPDMAIVALLSVLAPNGAEAAPSPKAGT